jgi:hypothetical protein
MHSRFARLASVALLALGVGIARADTVYTDTRAMFGRVVSLDPTGVTIAPGCAGDRQESVLWVAARAVVFDDRCDAPQARIPSAGGGICSTNPTRRFLIHHTGRDRPVAADGVRLGSDGIVHYRDEARGLDGHGPRSALRGITYGLVCPDDIAGTDVVPGFCVEAVARAVNFSFDTPLENRVLTRGFAYYLEFGEPGVGQRTVTPQLRELVRQGFGTAITHWISELWRRKENYPDAMQVVLESFVSRSQSGFVLVTPPQVISRECPHAANFVVRIYTAEVGPFAPGIRPFAAFAQRPGRTIALNFARYPCWEHSYAPRVRNAETGCVNIVPIFVHELGHAFGLGHTDEADSVMQEIVGVAIPSARDLDRLAAELQRAVAGGAPGLLQIGAVDDTAARLAEGISIEPPHH